MAINTKPTRDGETTVYENEEAKRSKWWNPRGKVIFVNGMLNSGENHRESALALSLLQMCRVIGVYNLSNSFLGDLGQCIADKYQFDGPLAHDPKQALDAVLEAEAKGLSRAAAMEKVLERNPPTLTLFRLLRGQEHRETPVFAHSQGNLILSNALAAISAVDGRDALVGREIRTFGSPTKNWPDGITPIECGFSFDPVTWLAGVDWSFRISKLGRPSGSVNPITHGFLLYVQEDAAFIVNRYRWGSLGMTFSLDEKGLAGALVKLGRNMPRVRAVFEHLQRNHRSDVDDVALLYVEALRKASNRAELFQFIKADYRLHRLLIKAMEDGWTSRRERNAITLLESL